MFERALFVSMLAAAAVAVIVFFVLLAIAQGRA